MQYRLLPISKNRLLVIGDYMVEEGCNLENIWFKVETKQNICSWCSRLFFMFHVLGISYIQVQLLLGQNTKVKVLRVFLRKITTHPKSLHITIRNMESFAKIRASLNPEATMLVYNLYGIYYSIILLCQHSNPKYGGRAYVLTGLYYLKVWNPRRK